MALAVNSASSGRAQCQPSRENLDKQEAALREHLAKLEAERENGMAQCSVVPNSHRVALLQLRNNAIEAQEHLRALFDRLGLCYPDRPVEGPTKQGPTSALGDLRDIRDDVAHIVAVQTDAFRVLHDFVTDLSG